MTSLSKELKCIGCEKIFFSKQGYEKHILSNICSKRIDRYVCKTCGLDCKQKINYEKHMNKKKKCKVIEQKESINNDLVNIETVINETVINETVINETVINENKNIENNNIISEKLKKLEKENEELKKNNTFLENQNQRYLKREEEKYKEL
jgi:hypothetical protein